jgi:hypothetical protein
MPLRRQIVKTYGRDSLLVWMNPLISALQATLGLRVGFRSDAEVLQKMESDTMNMAERGYRVVSADQFELPVFGPGNKKASWYRVTYELAEEPRT